MSRLGDSPSFLRLVRWAAAGLLIALALTLSMTSLSGYRVVQGAHDAVVRGQGEAILQTVALGTRRGTITDQEILKGVYETEMPRGLRCVVLLDAALRPAVTAGECLTPAAAMGELVTRHDELSRINDRTRMLLLPPPPPPPPPPPGLLLPPQGMPPPPGAPWPVSDTASSAELAPPSGPGWPGPPPQDYLKLPPREPSATGPRAPRPVLIEFAPQMAQQLRQSARRTLLSGGGATLALLIAAAIFWRLSLREERAYATKERQRQLASLGEMAAVLAHELRNPLAALKGHAQLLSEQLPSGSRPHDKATRVVTEAERLEALSNDLLSFVRTTVLEPRMVSPAELLSECAQSTADPRIEVTTREAPPRWRCDPDRLRQVLANLLRNALEASSPDGRVLAEARAEGAELVFVVRDFGKGIREQDLERIFEPFYTTRARGTGLGLAISRRLVALHGGSITASNAQDGGAVFRISLPATIKGAAS